MPTESARPKPAAPGRPGLSFDTFEQAYHDLCGPDGTPPSQRQLRKYLGTGSNTTLANYRRRIAENRQADELPPEEGALDAELLATVQRLARQIALGEAQVADDRVSELQTDADNRIRVAEATLEKRLQDTAVLEHRATAAEVGLAELQNKLAEKDAQIATLRSDLHTVREAHAALTQSSEDMTRQLALSLRQHDNLQQTVEQVRLERQAAAEQHQNEMSELNQALGESRAALATMTEQHAGLTTRLDERNTLIETQNTQCQQLQQRLDRATEARENGLIELDELKRALAELQSRYSTASTELAAETRAHQASTASFEKLMQEKEHVIVDLRERLKAVKK